MSDSLLWVTEIQRFCMHDGPGLRTTVFLKGCPLRCEWCHNPETRETRPEILYYAQKCVGCGACAAVCPNGAHRFTDAHVFDRSLCGACGACAHACPSDALKPSARLMTIEEIADAAERDRAFYGADGGVTLSGGEPLMHADKAAALLKELRRRGLGTAVETCGVFDGAYLAAVAENTDLFLWDVKDTDDARHRRYTGASNRQALDNLLAADRLGAKTVLRCILVNGVNTDAEHYSAVAELYRKLKNCAGVQFIPYHAYGGAKMTALGLADNGKKEWIPSKETVAAAEKAVKN